MAETYKHLDSGLHQPPAPVTSFVDDPEPTTYGIDFPNQEPRPENYKPVANYPYEQVEKTAQVGEFSLNKYQNLPVPPEDYPIHSAINPAELYSRATTYNAKNELADTETVTHHTGQQVHYKYDPATGLYVYRGLVFPRHEKDVPFDEKQPIGNDMKYFHRLDRSDYYDAPLATSVGTTKDAIPSYSIHNARFYKPIPKQFDGGGDDYAQTGRASLGNATYNKTVYVN